MKGFSGGVSCGIAWGMTGGFLLMTLTMLPGEGVADDTWWARDMRSPKRSAVRSPFGTKTTPIPGTASQMIFYSREGEPLDMETLVFCDVPPGVQCTADKVRQLPDVGSRLLATDWSGSVCNKAGATKPQARSGDFANWKPDDASYLSFINRFDSSSPRPKKATPRQAWSALYFDDSGSSAIATECLMGPGGMHPVRDEFVMLEGKTAVNAGTPAPCTTPPFLCSYFYKGIEYCKRC